MSATAGILRFDGRPVDRRDLERMGNALRAHGPDRSGLYTSGSLGLTHLLSRMTPEDVFDRQPLGGTSGAIMAADIRLDNRDDLAAALALDRERANTLADSAIALAAWERWGNETWARLRGPFAIAVWEPRDQVLTLARTPMGVNLVTWHRSSDFFAFATLPKGLFALPDVPRELNEEKFADFLVLNHADHETTIYRDLFRLPPAHVLTIDSSGSINMRRYWSAHDIAPIRLESDQAYAEAMREHLNRAVRRQLRSAHPVGCFLSGGLDSSSVAALAARALAEKGKRLPAYTHVPRKGFDGPTPRGWYADETPYVETIRQVLETIDVTYVDNGSCDDFAALEAVFHATDLPVRNPTNMGWLFQIARQAHANGQRVLLCGESGNATISWDGWEQTVDHLLAGRLPTACRQWLQFYRQSSRSLWGSFWMLFVAPLMPRELAARSDRRAHPHRIAPWQDHAAIRPDYAQAIGVDERARRVGHDFLYRPQRGRLGRIAMLHLIDFRGEHHAGMLAAHGVELRDPTTDLDVVSFCLSVPNEQYLAEGVSRSLIRRAMWGILPPEVLAKRKRGMQAADWFEKLERRLPEIHEEIAQLARSPLARKMIDIDRLAKAARNWPTGNWAREDVFNEYHLALSRGLGSGRFLRWFEQTN